jgi:hypothetical protein
MLTELYKVVPAGTIKYFNEADKSFKVTDESSVLASDGILYVTQNWLDRMKEKVK